MTAYNVISPASLVAGQPEDISVVLSNLQAIQGVLNGGIDNGNINAAAAIAASKLAGYPSDATKNLRGDGSWAVPAPLIVGDELAYAESTAGGGIATTTEATAATCLNAPVVTCDGITPIIVEFFSPVVLAPAVTNGELNFVLYDGSTAIGQLGQVRNPAAVSTGTPVYARRKLTPSAGTHTYSVRAYVSAGSGWFGSGPGGPGNSVPAHVRVLRVSPIPPSVAPGSFTAVYYGTTLPASPADGQEAILVDNVTAPTYQWRFRYNAGSSSPYKWECVGGSPLVGVESTSVALVLGTPSNLGPGLLVPRTGTYVVRASMDVQAAAVPAYVTTQWANFNTGTVVASGRDLACQIANLASSPAWDDVTNLTAGHLLVMKFTTQIQSITVRNRAYSITPVRLA